MIHTFNSLIEKKKHKQELTYKELKWLIEGYVDGTVKDYQMASMTMAIWFNGMTDEETTNLTKVYVETGDVYDVSMIKGLKADKHSTGGIGDKTSLALSPILASYGISVCKMSGRGLGVTGGTIDKLESCPGWTGELNEKEFINTIQKTHIAIVSQSANIAPADKKIYALRDVIGTADSIPLIAASIMSKKLAVHTDSLILDIKVGSGAFMKTIEEARTLANLMVKIGEGYGRKVSVMISNMSKPLGRAIGNAIEAKEAWDTLNGQGPIDFVETVATAAGITLVNLNIFDNLEKAVGDVKNKLNSKEAAHFLKDFIVAQKGDFSVIENYDKNFTTKHEIKILADKSGYIVEQDALKVGLLAMELGAGRKTKEDQIDFAAGIYLNKKEGEKVSTGDVVMTLYTNKQINPDWEKQAKESFEIGAELVETWDCIF